MINWTRLVLKIICARRAANSSVYMDKHTRRSFFSRSLSYDDDTVSRFFGLILVFKIEYTIKHSCGILVTTEKYFKQAVRHIRINRKILIAIWLGSANKL